MLIALSVSQPRRLLHTFPADLFIRSQQLWLIMRRRDIIYYVAADDLRRVLSRFRLTYTRCNVMRDLSQTKQLDGQGYVKLWQGKPDLVCGICEREIVCFSHPHKSYNGFAVNLQSQI